MIDWLIDHAPSARHLVVFNLVQWGIWLLLVPPTVLWWADSIPWLSFMSIAALVLAAFSALCASLAAMAADR